MAAIIAQMSRAKSERGKRKRFDISKCVYTLDPFDQCFDPDVSISFLLISKNICTKCDFIKFFFAKLYIVIICYYCFR